MKCAVVCTDGSAPRRITGTCLGTIQLAAPDKIVFIKQCPSHPRSLLSYFTNLICGIQQCPSDSMVFVCEHDVLYPYDYFDRDIRDGKPSYGTGGYTLTRRGFFKRQRAPLSSLAGPAHVLRELFIRKMCESVEGDAKWAEPDYTRTPKFRLPTPFIDIRHGDNYTGDRLAATYVQNIDSWEETATEMWECLDQESL